MPVSIKERSLFLLKHAQFFTLASRSLDGSVWAATLSYVVNRIPLKIIWCSERHARHSENLRHDNRVSGALYLADLPVESPLGIDGAQFIGVSREVSENETDEAYRYFSCQKFPDESIRTQWMPPLSEFARQGSRRFYELDITELWLLDTDRWLESKKDKRIAVDLSNGL